MEFKQCHCISDIYLNLKQLKNINNRALFKLRCNVLLLILFCWSCKRQGVKGWSH